MHVAKELEEKVWAMLCERSEGKTLRELDRMLSNAQKPLLAGILNRWIEEGDVRLRRVAVQWDGYGQPKKWAEKYQRYTLADRKYEARVPRIKAGTPEIDPDTLDWA